MKTVKFRKRLKLPEVRAELEISIQKWRYWEKHKRIDKKIKTDLKDFHGFCFFTLLISYICLTQDWIWQNNNWNTIANKNFFEWLCKNLLCKVLFLRQCGRSNHWYNGEGKLSETGTSTNTKGMARIPTNI